MCTNTALGVSPGLAVTGGGSESSGNEFISQQQRVKGYFSHIDFCRLIHLKINKNDICQIFVKIWNCQNTKKKFKFRISFQLN